MQAFIQTFYKGTGTNHPLFPNEAAGLPNWFHYYAQTYLPPRAGFDANNNGFVGQWNPNDDTIHIYPGAHKTFRLHIFAIPPGSTTVQWIGDLKITGLLSYLQVARHEQGHRELNNAGIQVGGTTPIGADAGDDDGVVDAWEDQHFLRHNNPDTTGAYPELHGMPNINNPDIGKADRECLCDILSYGMVKAALDQKTWKTDWADDGIQFGTHVPTPSSALFYPITFLPRDWTSQTFGTDTDVLPASALTTLP